MPLPYHTPFGWWSRYSSISTQLTSHQTILKRKSWCNPVDLLSLRKQTLVMRFRQLQFSEISPLLCSVIIPLQPAADLVDQLQPHLWFHCRSARGNEQNRVSLTPHLILCICFGSGEPKSSTEYDGLQLRRLRIRTQCVSATFLVMRTASIVSTAHVKESLHGRYSNGHLEKKTQWYRNNIIKILNRTLHRKPGHFLVLLSRMPTMNPRPSCTHTLDRASVWRCCAF